MKSASAPLKQLFLGAVALAASAPGGYYFDGQVSLQPMTVSALKLRVTTSGKWVTQNGESWFEQHASDKAWDELINENKLKLFTYIDSIFDGAMGELVKKEDIAEGWRSKGHENWVEAIKKINDRIFQTLPEGMEVVVKANEGGPQQGRISSCKSEKNTRTGNLRIICEVVFGSGDAQKRENFDSGKIFLLRQSSFSTEFQAAISWREQQQKDWLEQKEKLKAQLKMQYNRNLWTSFDLSWPKGGNGFVVADGFLYPTGTATTLSEAETNKLLNIELRRPLSGTQLESVFVDFGETEPRWYEAYHTTGDVKQKYQGKTGTLGDCSLDFVRDFVEDDDFSEWWYTVRCKVTIESAQILVHPKFIFTKSTQ